MATIRSYRDLIVWQDAIQLAKIVYKLSAKFPSDERFGLTSQIRRAAVSIPSNIAEGHGRATTREYIRFLNIALGSLAELETQICLAVELEFCSRLDVNEAQGLAGILGRKLHALQRSIKKKVE